MKALIEIPTKDFGVDITDKFQDFFKRLQVETKNHLISNTNLVCGSFELETIEMFLNAFEEMQVIPDNATNGDVITAMFPNISVYEHGSTYSVNNEYNFNSTWWNAPYKRGNENGSN